MMDKKNVFIIGSKGIPANYGGFETFVDNLVSKQRDNRIQYYVTCLADKESTFKYNGAICKNIAVPSIGSARAVLYDILSLKWIAKYIKENDIRNGIVCILACRIGPFINKYKKQLKKNGFELVINPDGHEWKRSKWPFLIKKYWKISEKFMIKHADKVVCDSKGIKKYIDKTYKKYNPKTTFIAYGADVADDIDHESKKYVQWKKEKEIEKPYFLIVGRFVPENNIELIIKEFMDTDVNFDLIFVTNVEENKCHSILREKTNFEKDQRIKFVGTVYDQELLTEIRQNAFAYIHGHSVGGTNPSLLEALGTTKLNLLYDVNFNREVGADSALYFSDEKGDLAKTLNEVSRFDENTLGAFESKAKNVIRNRYSWEKIVTDYEKLFIS
jgi:rhamnosyltransferase